MRWTPPSGKSISSGQRVVLPPACTTRDGRMRSVSTPPTRPSRRDLVTTGKAADAVGVSHRSLLYWVSKCWIKPTWRSPSGRYMWSVDHLESQLAAMEEPPPEQE